MAEAFIHKLADGIKRYYSHAACCVYAEANGDAYLYAHSWMSQTQNAQVAELVRMYEAKD